MLDDAEVKKVLVVTAHPDDVDFAAAGTVAAWTRRGVEVVYCVVTDGDAGGFDRLVDHGGMAALRRAEQENAAKAVGVTDVRSLGYPDGVVEATLGLRRDITRVIRQVRPDLVLTQSPDRDYARIAPSHPDHRAVGSAALDAVYPDARNPYAFPELLLEEGLAAWTVREVWLSGGPTADHFVDITDTFEQKVAALRAHESQTGHIEDVAGFLRPWLSANAERAGLPAGRLAEAFQVVDTA
ncbi:PIG-L deacetylase family protein [Bailinhaonella thermotolerans]|uniref:PIG-L family deacetylase n=1 Tax=Bailinhaonella thermotolerans TaxID=1070861 RepID=A0A3A4A4H5_9ACTN|nr:PIG-L deacetylase family protein [Bailinhaonella thermotolerans]RJL23686.1 PIG-L family deacetylase [Bailinhaonella thermotolerans]